MKDQEIVDEQRGLLALDWVARVFIPAMLRHQAYVPKPSLNNMRLVRSWHDVFHPDHSDMWTQLTFVNRGAGQEPGALAEILRRLARDRLLQAEMAHRHAQRRLAATRAGSVALEHTAAAARAINDAYTVTRAAVDLACSHYAVTARLAASKTGPADHVAAAEDAAVWAGLAKTTVLLHESVRCLARRQEEIVVISGEPCVSYTVEVVEP
jgi:hypothetical protein